MKFKNIGIILSIIIGITIIGTIAITLNQTQDSTDKHAVSLDTLKILLQNKEHVLVVDIRDAQEYQSGHLVGASHDVLDSTTIEKRVNTIQSKLPDVAVRYNFVLVDDDETQAKQVAQNMTEMGIQTFYLDGGMNNLSENLVTSNSQTVIDSKELMKRLESNEDLYLLDVRQPDELLESKIDGAVNIPLAEIFKPNGMNAIPNDKPVVVICGSGNRATIASYALAQEGIDFQVLEGGMNAWNAQIREKTDK
ncbi:MAG: rhodanese-like domain-containing protein [Nitrosopumilus sp.]|nr:rhodanese-like domain-containing protein [Nitrosopumilus sp.]MDH3490151.1 rhodanese-like domain-containing protein [Nitrosopumilus sp.]MDH3516890.1 rhodanese-like domain-containing protein [Nitrosopumilus sp.]MDH3565264.1 rhodanese-like domain-containing protein [Nitrosopumilus sp.]MDH5416679.1 rhodanese-like domain-containing protein [Nitrosopumilus sp.]